MLLQKILSGANVTSWELKSTSLMSYVARIVLGATSVVLRTAAEVLYLQYRVHDSSLQQKHDHQLERVAANPADAQTQLPT